MKILLLLNNDNYCVKALDLLAQELKNHEVKILLSRKVGASEVGEILVQIKKIEGFLVDENFAKLQKKLNYEIDFCENINSEISIKEIKKFAPDLIISIRFGQIIRRELIKIPQFGIVNLHSGILPKYRGIMATLWTILQGEEEIGTSLHYIENAEIDKGAIIKISKQKINFNLSLLENISSLYLSGCADILEFLEKIKNKQKIEVVRQENLAQPNYFSQPREDDLIRCGERIRLF
jgi:methionyl-tRNA formyltransferase